MENVTILRQMFNITEQAYEGAQQEYQEYRYQIDGYIFFSTIREIPDIQ
jgi:hypothetical protein